MKRNDEEKREEKMRERRYSEIARKYVIERSMAIRNEKISMSQ